MAGSNFARHCETARLPLCMAVALVLASPALAQTMRTRQTVIEQPAVMQPEEIFTEEIYTGEEAGSYARYAEPPPPPFDYWQPTWMPCQTLRTNRSLVLGHLWFGMDIMGWTTKGVHAPPLVTTSPLGTPEAEAGVLGESGTRVLFGGEFQHNEMRPGGKLTIGWWFDPNQYCGIEWHYFELDGHNTRFNQTVEEGDGILARPFIDASTGEESSLLVSFPGEAGGQIRAWSDLQLTSTGIIYRDLYWASQYARLDYLIGYRHTHLYDRLRFNQISLTDNSRISDEFRAFNSFDGLDLGLRGWWSTTGKLALTGLAKMALGASNTNVVIDGFAVNAEAPGQGVLALRSNIGGHPHQEFGIVSEVGIGLEWLPVCQVRLSLGYTWFYWSDVARALSHVDRTLDLDQLATGVASDRPAFDLQMTSFWAQGLNAGFVYEF